jgi:hypothetical protein
MDVPCEFWDLVCDHLCGLEDALAEGRGVGARLDEPQALRQGETQATRLDMKGGDRARNRRPWFKIIQVAMERNTTKKTTG